MTLYQGLTGLPPNPLDDVDEDFLPPSWQFQDEDQPALTFWPVAERRRADPVLIPLARAQDAIARLEAGVEAASPDVAAGLRARRALTALQTVERKAADLKTGGRSHLADAVGFALREPVVTARGLGEGIGVSTRSALDLAKRLVDEGLLREATGRLAWRAFVIEG